MGDRSAAELLKRVAPPKGVAAVAVVDPDASIDLAGDDPATTGLYEIGSITKTLTATLLAVLVDDGVVALDTTVGAILGEQAGAIPDVTLRELATHTGGLPRLAPNAFTVPFWPRDPYRFYDAKRLVKGLAKTTLTDPGTIAYSNFGFDLLGHCLEAAARTPFKTLMESRVLVPAGMTTARCQPCPRRGLLRGHGSLLLGGRRWHQPLPAAGGVDGTIADLAAWARANLVPDSTPLANAIRLAQQEHAANDDGSIGLAWHRRNSTLWHNGATGSFQGFVAVAPGRMAVAALATMGPGKWTIDRPVGEWLTEALAP